MRYERHPYIALALLGRPALAASISGTASVIDGDTIDVHGHRISSTALTDTTALLRPAPCEASHVNDWTARNGTGYLGDMGMEPPYPPGDFAAGMEVCLDGRWWVFDPPPRIGRVVVARGRDAADVPLLHFFGTNVLTGLEGWTDQLV